MKPTLKLNVFDERAILPSYAHVGDSGFDLCCLGDLLFLPGSVILVSTGLRVVSLPAETELQVRSKSGLALKHGLVVLNSPGTVDASYRGELKVILKNTSNAPVSLAAGDKIAQCVICPVLTANIVASDEIQDTTRGEGGFGSTGK